MSKTGIRKDPKTGIYQIDVTVEGRRVQKTSGTTSLKAAKELKAKITDQLWREVKLGEAPKITFEQLAAYYVDEKQKKGTLEDDKDKLRWLMPHLGSKLITDITSSMVSAVLEIKKKDNVTDSTVNRYAALISTMLNMAHDKGWTTQKIKVNKKKEIRGSYIWLRHQDDAMRLIRELEGTAPHLAQMVRFSLATGLRQYNVTHLEWDRVDLERKIAYVRPEDAKAKKFIPVPLNDFAMEVLAQQVDKHGKWVFPYAGRSVANPNNSAFKKALVRAKIHLVPKTDETGKVEKDRQGKPIMKSLLRWHDLRHTWASWHVQAGTPLLVLKELGGWSSLSMVERYAHLAPSHLAQHSNNIELRGLSEVLVNQEKTPLTDCSESGVDIGGLCGDRTHDKRIKRTVED